MSYIDGFVAAVPADSKEAYRAFSADVASIFLAHGATRVVECWGDDVPDGTVTDFKRAVQAKDGEVVAFSWIVWPSRTARDSGSQAAMADPRMPGGGQMPFDGKRLIYGGFEIMLDMGR